MEIDLSKLLKKDIRDVGGDTLSIKDTVPFIRAAYAAGYKDAIVDAMGEVYDQQKNKSVPSSGDTQDLVLDGQAEASPSNG